MCPARTISSTRLLGRSESFKTSNRDFAGDAASQGLRKRATRVQDQGRIALESKACRGLKQDVIPECDATVDGAFETVGEMMVSNESRSGRKCVYVDSMIANANGLLKANSRIAFSRGR
jgi:hypothetical protein